MSRNDNLLVDNPNDQYNLVPLYEGKMIHQYDHRWATYEDGDIRKLTLAEKHDPNYLVTPRYWINKAEVESWLSGKWHKKWMIGFREVTKPTDERTALFSLVPKVAVNGSIILLLTTTYQASLVSCLLGCLNSLIFDFVVRQKVGGVHLGIFIMKQLPVLPPDRYSEEDINYISSRVLELTYTSWEMKPFAEDMGYEGEPFIWDEGRRAKLRAELDAYYAKLYGLTRNELRYILDPKDVYGEDFPSETFRVLKENEIQQYGEYRTQRLVLSAWDKLNA
jgi:hypothetical protein